MSGYESGFWMNLTKLSSKKEIAYPIKVVSQFNILS